MLVENCYLCHSDQITAPQADLRLDTREGVLKGGSRGPAIVPGEPEKSLLIKAISYRDLQLKMPPTGKLSDEQIADFIAWVKMGAPDPRTDELPPVVQAEQQGIDFEEGRRFWFFQRIQDPPLPLVKQRDWPRSSIDHFILAKLEEKGLTPAPPADRGTWIRRVTFDLTGLPPAPQEIGAFLWDDSPDAYEKVVDRLLASPHYGERWGRHWLDLVRFAETNGHEYDNDKLDAWRYRDYVIRAFNSDVPYNQFVKEHIAGDLIPEKRIRPDGVHWESPLGTNLYWFGEVLNSATDSIKSRADEVDNQIDVMSKAFLGLTVACARCHDHKFDPIPTTDYYSLAGMMHSTGISETIINSPSRARQIASAHQKIVDTNEQIRKFLRPEQVDLAQQLKDYLLAAAELVSSTNSEGPTSEEKLAKEKGLSPSLLTAWVTYLEQARGEPEHVFYPFVTIVDRLAEGSSPPLSKLVSGIHQELEQLVAQASLVHPHHRDRGDIVYEDFEKLNYEGWRVSGQAFGEGPLREVAPNQGIRGYQGESLANSFRGGSEKLVGSLTSEKFKMPKLYLHVRMAGSKENGSREKAKLRLTLVADGYKSQHLLPEGNDNLQWKTARLTKEIGRLCYFEIVDRSPEGHILVDKIVLSDSKEPPSPLSAPNKYVRAMLSRSSFSSLESLAQAYQELFIGALGPTKTSNRDTRALLTSLIPTGKLEDVSAVLSEDEVQQLVKLQDRRAVLEEKIPETVFAMVARDENPRNIRVHIRGNHNNLGEEVPRRYLQIIAGQDQMPITHGSGRLQLAEWLVRSENPQTARVMVNRVWKHHFGHGIVRSADNFGKTGERPTHPELLDFLAKRFMESGWSVKAIHRMMLLSSTSRMSGQVDEVAAKTDPQNKLLHHMPVRRLEAEAIRDSILAVAGTLDRQLFGPSVPPHISEYQDGRGKPESGPLDGSARRSIYIQVRRNFITPMFLAFDYPLPVSAMGRRSVSTVASQALMMMNNEFVVLQAQEWARRLTAAENEPGKRVEQMYLTAFGRPPENWEMAEVLQFIESQKSRYEASTELATLETVDHQVWSDLCHVLLNSAEFIYIR
ncbi:MAG: PSD1 and planctomycete cytochrome C domain-containing protein [Acidobacteriota bacterium]